MPCMPIAMTLLAFLLDKKKRHYQSISRETTSSIKRKIIKAQPGRKDWVKIMMIIITIISFTKDRAYNPIIRALSDEEGVGALIL